VLGFSVSRNNPAPALEEERAARAYLRQIAIVSDHIISFNRKEEFDGELWR
jgi:hypothetical protein